MPALVLHICLHDGRYHGDRDWPPSPARLFQALVAGAGLGGPLGDTEKEALRWLEEQGPPTIAAPLAWRPRQGVLVYMPNNDSDRIGGDPQRMSKIRTARKVFRPYLFDAAIPFVYAWTLIATDRDNGFAHSICSLAERLYQLGRGIDMAWAWGDLLDDCECEDLLARYPGDVFRPSSGRSPTTLQSPSPGSLESIGRRYRAYGERFHYVNGERAVKAALRTPPRPRFRPVSYDSPGSCQLYELREPIAQGSSFPWPLARVSALIGLLRDAAVERLVEALPTRRAEIECVLVGRKPDGSNDGPVGVRVRILPLPSIGHVHADREIRRILVEVPPTCPLRPDDVRWAFSGLDVADTETGEILATLTWTDGHGFLRHYGIEDDRRHRMWRTVTPAALPENARRRINPPRMGGEAKAGRERATEQTRAAAAVRHALRHAGIRTSTETVRVQREPFEARGARVEAFSAGTRFAKQRLWHVELALQSSISGPLVIGDGRFLGLGVMAPLQEMVGIHVLVVKCGLLGDPEPEQVVRALRRAVMARVQALLDNKPLPAFFAGHELDGGPARVESSSHLAFACDLVGSRLIIVAPHVLDRRTPTRTETDLLAVLDEALMGMDGLRAGPAGFLRLGRTRIEMDQDALTMPSRVWESVTPYVVARHARVGDATEVLVANLTAECRRRELPAPSAIFVREIEEVAASGLSGRCTLKFNTAVRGPILLGRNRFLGGGLFVAKRENAAERIRIDRA